MRSCNLCGDLVDQKDRIQPTSKKPSPIRRPPPGRPTSNSEYNEFQNYYHSMIDEQTTPTSSTSTHTASNDYEEHEQEHTDHYANNETPEESNADSSKPQN